MSLLRNPYREFLDLLPPRPLLVGTVEEVADEIATVALPGGGQVTARGQAAVGQRVFVRDGLIEGLAPELTYVTAEV